METRDPVDSIAVLESVGFRPDKDHGPNILVYDFGTFQLRATRCLTPLFADVVMLHGIYASRNTMSEVEHEMPAEESSREVVLAHVAWTVDRIGRGPFQPAIPAPWLEDGRSHVHLLPWERRRLEWQREQAVYRRRPNCDVGREWMRVCINTLARFSQEAPQSRHVTVHFDGHILSFSADRLRCAMAATGLAWPKRFSVTAWDLGNLQQRLTKSVNVGVWNGELVIGRVRVPASELDE